jgi:uncharacterized membrane protein
MAKIEHSIDIAVPVREAYDQWTQFEDFPRFMENVESVRQIDDTHLHWIATIAGKRQEWDAEITEQTPDQRIAWTSITGDPNGGAVDFHRLGEERTRVTLTMDVEPEGVVEKVGTALGVPSSQVKGDLERFKEFIESRGTATGAWRGEVEQNDVTGSRSGSRERELTGAGTMGTVGAGTELGTDYGVGTTKSSAGITDPYETGDASTYDTGTTTGTTGTGETGTGLNNPQDLGTGRREEF